MVLVACAAALTLGAVPQQEEAPPRPLIELVGNEDLVPEMNRSMEQSLKEQGLSPAGIAIVMAEVGGSGPNDPEQAATAKLLAGMKRYESVLTQASPNAIDVINAGREGRAATRAFIDLMVAGRERILLRLSPADLKAYLNVYGAIDTKLMLGMF